VTYRRHAFASHRTNHAEFNPRSYFVITRTYANYASLMSKATFGEFIQASKFEDIQELAIPHEVCTNSTQTRVTRLALPAVSHDLLVAYLVVLALASPFSRPAPSNAPSVGLTRPQLPSINLTVHHQPNAHSINLMHTMR
jgi:hypothetical protein